MVAAFLPSHAPSLRARVFLQSADSFQQPTDAAG